MSTSATTRRFAQDPDLQAVFMPLLLMCGVIYLCQRMESDYEINQCFFFAAYSRNVFVSLYIVAVSVGVYNIPPLSKRFPHASVWAGIYSTGIFYAGFLYSLIFVSKVSMREIMAVSWLDLQIITSNKFILLFSTLRHVWLVLVFRNKIYAAFVSMFAFIVVILLSFGIGNFASSQHFPNSISVVSAVVGTICGTFLQHLMRRFSSEWLEINWFQILKQYSWPGKLYIFFLSMIIPCFFEANSMFIQSSLSMSTFNLFTLIRSLLLFTLSVLAISDVLRFITKKSLVIGPAYCLIFFILSLEISLSLKLLQPTLPWGK